MAENAPTPESKQETPLDAKKTREQSKIEWPYTAMDLAIALAQAVHALGNQCDWAQLGARLDLAPDGGGFRQRLAAAKMFGLINYTSRNITLTSLGVQINDPDQSAAAKASAFLSVQLYKAIYEQYRNGTLPGPEGLENAMVSLGVPQKQKEKARQAFQRSATEAGFFSYGPNRLVMPSVKPLKNPELPTEKQDTPLPSGNGGSGGGGGDGSGGGGGKTERKLNPFIEGLLETLPATAPTPNKAEWSLQGRLDWLQTAVGVFNLIYKIPADETGTVRVTVEQPKSSAN